MKHIIFLLMMIVLSSFAYGLDREVPDSYFGSNQTVHLHFNESSGTIAIDSLGFKNWTGVNLEGTEWESRTDYGNAVHLDGSNEHFYLATNGVNMVKGFICGWVNSDGYTNGDDTVFHKDNSGDFYCQYLTSPSACIYCDTPSGTDFCLVPKQQNTWQHFCLGFDGSSFLLYNNGTYKGSYAGGTLTALMGSGKFAIGGNHAGSGTFDGLLDDWIFFNNTNLSAYNVSQIYNASWLDSANPLINFTAPTEANDTYWARNWIYVNVTASDPNYASTNITLWNSTAYVTSFSGKETNFTSLNDDIYYINATAYDITGNSNKTETRQIVLDNKSPVVNATYPPNSTLSNSLINIFNCTISDVNIANLSLYIWNSSDNSIINITVTQLTGSSNFTGWIKTLPDSGIYKWNCLGYDKVNNLNWSDNNLTITIDTINPSINFTAPTEANNTYWARNWIYANFTVSDSNYNNTNITLWNSTQFISSSGNNETNFTSLADGRYYLNATVWDRAGNSNKTETRQIILDNTNPSINFTLPTLANNTHITYNYIYVNVTSDDANYNNTILNMYDNLGALIESYAGREHNFTGLSTNTYYFNATSYDTLGHSNSTETRKIVMDIVPPAITWNSPSSDVIISNPYYLINISLYDAYLDAVNLTIYNASGSIIYNNESTGLIDTTYNYSMYINFSSLGASGTNTIEACARDSLEDSPDIIFDNSQKDNVSTEQDINGVNVIRELGVLDDKLKIVDPKLYKLNRIDNFDGKHIKSIYASENMPKGYSYYEDFTSDKGFIIYDKKGIKRIVDADYLMYVKFDDLENSGYTVEIKELNKTSVRVIFYKSEYLSKEIVDPIAGGLSTTCENKTITYNGAGNFVFYNMTITNGSIQISNSAWIQAKLNGTTYNLSDCVVELNNTNYTGIITNGNECHQSFVGLTDGYNYTYVVYANNTIYDLFSTGKAFFIENSIPSDITNASLLFNDSYLRSDEDLLCYTNTTVLDAENTTQYEFKLYVNGALQYTTTSINKNESLAHTYYVRGDNITCGLRLYDGYEYNNQVNITTNAYNSLPTATNVNISGITSNDTFTGNYTFNDYDSDADNSNYGFYKNGVFYNNTFSISGIEGDNITFQITPCDAYGCGTSVNSSTVTVTPIPPSILYLSPNEGFFNQFIPITCYAESYDNLTLYYYIDMYYDNGTSTGWHPIAVNSSQGSFLFSLVNVTPQNNVSLRCNATDLRETTSNLYVNGTITFLSMPSVQLVNEGARDIFYSKVPYNLGVICSAYASDQNITIFSSWADCESDGIRDYYWLESELSPIERTKTHHTFRCISLDGINKITVGCVFNKINSSFSWNGICDGISDHETLCSSTESANLRVLG